MQLINISEINTPIELLAGQSAYISLEINMNRFIFNLFHIDQFKTDYVISTWFSTTPFENNIRYKNNKNRLYLQRSLPLVTSIKDRDYVNPQSTAIESYTIEVEKGKYYYNVQNMTGSPTLFKVTKEEVL